ncbi:PEP-CTERM sorting domain-containing protein [Agarivorans albus]
MVNGESLLASQVPEPSSIWLVLLGLVALKIKRSQV